MVTVTGPRRTKIEKIEHLSSRQVTFSKRRRGLINKAKEFSRLYGAEIAVIVFSNTKKLYPFASTSMEDILSRRDKVMKEKKSQHEAPSSSSSDSLSATAAVLQEENRALKLDCSRLKGMELDGMSLRELNELEKPIREGIESIEKRKIEVENYYQPVYMLEYSDRLDGNNSSGTRSSTISGRIESDLSEQFVDTCLHL